MGGGSSIFKRKNRISLFDAITVLLISYITISSVFPPLRVLFNNTLAVTISMLLWLIITLIKKPSFYLKPTIQRLITILFIIYTFIVPYLFGNQVIGNRYLALAPIFFLYIVYEYNAKFNQSINNLRIIKLTMLFALITLIKTMQALLINPRISRSIKSSGEYSFNLLSQGIGGYEFIYFLVLVFPVLMYLTFFSDRFKQKYQKITLIFLSIIVFTVIVISNYFTAFIVALSSILIMLLVRFIKRQKAFAGIVLIFGIIILLIAGNSLVIFTLEWMYGWVGNSLTAERILEMKYSILYGDDQIVSTSRWDLIRVSMAAFFNNPVFGTIAAVQSNVLSFETSAGQHSHLIDTFAFLGLMPGLAQIYIIFQPYVRRLKNSLAIELIIPVFYSIVMIFTFNTVTPSMGFAVGLLVPTVYDYLRKD